MPAFAVMRTWKLVVAKSYHIAHLDPRATSMTYTFLSVVRQSNSEWTKIWSEDFDSIAIFEKDVRDRTCPVLKKVTRREVYLLWSRN
jgi:hypothetical protein